MVATVFNLRNLYGEWQRRLIKTCNAGSAEICDFVSGLSLVCIAYMDAIISANWVILY